MFMQTANEFHLGLSITLKHITFDNYTINDNNTTFQLVHLTAAAMLRLHDQQNTTI